MKKDTTRAGYQKPEVNIQFISIEKMFVASTIQKGATVEDYDSYDLFE